MGISSLVIPLFIVCVVGGGGLVCFLIAVGYDLAGTSNKQTVSGHFNYDSGLFGSERSLTFVSYSAPSNPTIKTKPKNMKYGRGGLGGQSRTTS